MIKNNEKGFTLIELLVVIVLMLSILGIAILSFVNISNKKKEESWKQVKFQVETAAKEYFISNEYFLTALDNSEIGYVSVGTLVKENYLSKVTNPITGKQINPCDVVVVSKNNKLYNYNYCEWDKECYNKLKVEMNENCVMNEPSRSYTNFSSTSTTTLATTTTSSNSNQLETEDIIPNITLKAYKNEGASLNKKSAVNLESYKNDTWYNKYVFVTVTNNIPNSQVKSFSCDVIQKNNVVATFTEYKNIRTEGVTNIKCKLDTKSGKSVETSYIVKLDRTKPNAVLTMKKKKGTSNFTFDTMDQLKTLLNSLEDYNKNTWYNKGGVFTMLTSTDNLSGVNYSQYTTTGSTENTVYKKSSNVIYRSVNKEGISLINYKVCDNANNCTLISTGNVKLDRTAPTINIGNNYKANCKSFKYWDKNDVQYKNTVYIEDTISGIKLTDYDYKYSGSWNNEFFGSDTKSKARANTAVLSRTSENNLKKIYQSYNFLVNSDSIFKIKACDNANNCTDYKEQKYVAKSSSSYNEYCRKSHAPNDTLKKRYLNQCASNNSINCWLQGDCIDENSSCRKDL